MFAIVICLVLLMCTLTNVLCVLMVECMPVVVNAMLSLISVMSPPFLVHPINTHDGVIKYAGCGCFRDELGFLNYDDVWMCIVNKKFELLEFVLDSVYVGLQYDEISLTFTAGSVSFCCVFSHIVVFGMSVRLSWYLMWMRFLM